MDGDGLDDLLIKAVTGVYLITGATIMDAGSGSDSAATGSKRFAWLDYGLGVGDVDGDGMPELVLPAHSYSEDTRVDSSYIISTTELTVLDTLDGKADYVIELDRTARHWSD